jgi:post-segregation antitoxin (ccd killing protein)
MKAGLKKSRKEGEDGVSKELSQLHLRATFEPMDSLQLSREERECTMESHLFLKQKKDGTIKGQMAAGGNKQGDTIDKTEPSSPAALLESALLASAIDAQERRDVAEINIPNAHVQTALKNEEDKATMRWQGELAEVMVEVAPEVHRKHVFINKKGETVLCVKLLNALCGILVKAALLFYKLKG